MTNSNYCQRYTDKISCELKLNKMANKTTTIKASEKTAQVLKIMKELKDLRRENIILKFKNDELTKQLNLCGVGKPKGELLNVYFNVGDKVTYTGRKAVILWTSVKYVDIELLDSNVIYQGINVACILPD